MGVLRRMLLNNRVADSTYFLLNKQAAATGIAVVIDDEQESPLGPIRVTLDCEELDVLIDWLVPVDWVCLSDLIPPVLLVSTREEAASGEVNYPHMLQLPIMILNLVQRSKFIKSDTPFCIELKNNER